MARKIAAPWGLSSDGELRRNVLIEFAEDDSIIKIEFENQNFDSIAGLEYYNGIIIPSMVNAHCHLELSHLKGQIPRNSNGLVGFLQNMSKDYGDISDSDRQNSIILSDRLMWLDGISAVGDISNESVSFDVKRKSKIKYHTFAEYYGFGCHPGDIEGYMDYKVGKLLRDAGKMGLYITPTPHSPYLVSDLPFKKANDRSMVSIHFLESSSEKEFYKKEGRLYRYVCEKRGDPDFLQYGTPVKRLINSINKSVKLILVHCTYINSDDIIQLQNHFKDISYVICPRSNDYIEGAFPPVYDILKYGQNVSIGTDSLASNDNLSMASEIEMLLRKEKRLELSTVLGWATQGGAKAIGLEDEFGSFVVGRKPGAVLVEGINLSTLKIETHLKTSRIV